MSGKTNDRKQIKSEQKPSAKWILLEKPSLTHKIKTLQSVSLTDLMVELCWPVSESSDTV